MERDLEKLKTQKREERRDTTNNSRACYFCEIRTDARNTFIYILFHLRECVDLGRQRKVYLDGERERER